MSDITALKLAVDLILLPSRVRSQRTGPLPDGVPFLLRVAAGDEEAMRDALDSTGKPPETLRAAAAFFIEQILLKPGADSYHILGANPDATASQLRQNLALLLRWLHPNVANNAQRSIFVTRVTSAWNDLKTPERRVAYDLARQSREPELETRIHDWPVAVSTIPERRKTGVDRSVGVRMETPPSARTEQIHSRRKESFLHRVLLLLMGEPGD